LSVYNLEICVRALFTKLLTFKLAAAISLPLQLSHTRGANGCRKELSATVVIDDGRETNRGEGKGRGIRHASHLAVDPSIFSAVA